MNRLIVIHTMKRGDRRKKGKNLMIAQRKFITLFLRIYVLVLKWQPNF